MDILLLLYTSKSLQTSPNKPNSNAIKTFGFDSVDNLKCRCDFKISPDELSFNLDQKSTRLLFISNNVDLNGSVKMRIRLERDERKQARQQLQLKLSMSKQ